MATEVDKLEQAYREKPKRPSTWSGLPLKEFYGPPDVARVDYGKDVGNPGEYPLTRGIHKDMYRGRYWTRREVSGFGLPEESNRRLRFHIDEGASGLSVIFDLPVQMGLDADHPKARGEVGVQGAPINTFRDMDTLLQDIPLDKITISFAESSLSCAVTLSQYIAVAHKQGVDPSKLRGTMHNDSLHMRYCGYGISTPVDLSVKMSVDIIEYCTRNMPSWNTININLYDLRETGINAPQEIAFGLSMASSYIEETMKRGLSVDDFAPRMAFYCSSHVDFFEEIAKLRAARKLWARIMKERFGAKDPRSWRFRFGVHTAGCSLVPQQPLNNAIRVAYQALAAVLGGAQSLHCCSYDEPICLPTETSNRLALRTQQMLAFETGVANVADPLGGSYYVESLTRQVEEEAERLLEEIDGMGGAIAASKSAWFDREIDKAALKYQQEVESGEKTVVGVNAFVQPPDTETPGGVLRIATDTEEEMVRRLRELKETRDQTRLRKAVEELRRHAEMGEKENLIPFVLDAVKADASMAEVIGTIRQAYGMSYDPLEVVQSPFFKD
ncbi:MAG: methylmalonyl-CoA mutase family protein [Dehalococcoidia bacterium]|jgi:methylmalonyl-CoA mutase N-terminal domain/subunit|nr:methylmalonyl-CoA mutase family protein [Dehalococcoidia bacterium]